MVPVLLILGASACSPTLEPMSARLYRDLNWSEVQWQRVQFFLSEDVVLRRQLSTEQATTQNGSIRIMDGLRVEEVILKKGTPGVLLFQPRSDRFAISFEEDDSRFLIFGPEQDLRGRYTLKAKRWDRQQGLVSYGDQTWYTDAQNAFAGILVDVKKARRTQKKVRQAKGRTINQ